MTPQEVEQIVLEALAALPIQVDNVHLHFHWHGDQDVAPPEDPVEPPDEEETPATRIVEMTESCAFFAIAGNNDAGYPLFDNAMIGKTVAPERWQVLAEAIVGDGAMLWWQIYRGANDDDSKKGYFIRKDKTKIIT